MAKPKRKSPGPFKFKHAVDVEARYIEPQILPSVRYLDADALSRAPKAIIEVAVYKTACCERYVRAVIEAGKVIRLDVDACTDAKPVKPNPQLNALMKAALKRARVGTATKWKPMPVKEFIAQAQERPVGGGVTECFEFCFIFGCYFCCVTGDRSDCVPVTPIDR